MPINKHSFNTIDEMQLYILEKLFSEGETITTREMKTLEICNVNLCLENPRNRNTYNEKRKWKFPLAIGEFAWHVSGSNTLDFITYYAKQWKNFSSDGKVIERSCYGHKIFKKDSLGNSQWTRLIELLKKEPFSRRAVLDIYESDNGSDYFAKDVACVSTAQFLIRNNKLDVIVNMRSNDLIWGLPYDIYLFTMLQELLSLELNVELGKYYHNVGSMHIYDRHLDLAKEMLEENNTYSTQNLKMDNPKELNTFLEYENIIRTTNINFDIINSFYISDYWKELLNELVKYKIKKQDNLELV